MFSKRFLVGFAAITSLLATSYGWTAFITTRQAFYLFPSFCFLCTLLGAIYVFISSKKTYSKMMASPKDAYQYALEINENTAITIKLPDEAEDLIATDKYYSYLYAKDILNRDNPPVPNRFVKGESEMAKDATVAFSYASVVLKRRFREGESAIIADKRSIIPYVRAVIIGTWHEAEETINRFDHLSKEYANILIERGLDAKYAFGVLQSIHPLENIYKHLLFTNPVYCVGYITNTRKKQWEEAEPCIAKESKSSVDYARFIGGKFPAGEPAIAKNAYSSLAYARIIKGRFLAGELTIAKIKDTAEQYANYLKDELKISFTESLMLPLEIYQLVSAPVEEEATESNTSDTVHLSNVPPQANKYADICLKSLSSDKLKNATIEIRMLPDPLTPILLKQVTDAALRNSPYFQDMLSKYLKNVNYWVGSRIGGMTKCDEEFMQSIEGKMGVDDTVNFRMKMHAEAKVYTYDSKGISYTGGPVDLDNIANNYNKLCSAIIAVLEDREQKAIATAESAFNYAKITGKRFVKGEDVIATDAKFSYLYARDILKGRFEKGEHALSESAIAATEYAVFLKDRFKKGEHAIGQSDMYAQEYADMLSTMQAINPSQGTVPVTPTEAYKICLGAGLAAKDTKTSWAIGNASLHNIFKRVIAKDAATAFCYAEYVLKGRFIDGEAAIAGNEDIAYQYAKHLSDRFATSSTEAHDICVSTPALRSIFERLIIDPKLCYNYACRINNAVPRCEAVLAKSAEYACLYANKVLKGRFILGEDTIAKDAIWSIRYGILVLGERFKKGEAAIVQACLDRACCNYSEIKEFRQLLIGYSEKFFPKLYQLHWQLSQQKKSPQEIKAAVAYLRNDIGGFCDTPEEATRRNKIARHAADYAINKGEPATIAAVDIAAYVSLHQLVKTDKEIAEAIKEEAQAAYLHAKDVLKGRYPEGEDAIAKDAWYSIQYARNVLNERFEKGEDTISKSPLSYTYAYEVVKGRFPQGEDAIAKEAYTSYQYAKFVIKGRFEKAENTIGNDVEREDGYRKGVAYIYGDFLTEVITPGKAYELLVNLPFENPLHNIFVHVINHCPTASWNYICKFKDKMSNKQLALFETSLAQDSLKAYQYATEIIKGRFVKGEAAIAQNSSNFSAYVDMFAKNPSDACSYAYTSKRRFEKGEDAIGTDPEVARRYGEFLYRNKLVEPSKAWVELIQHGQQCPTMDLPSRTVSLLHVLKHDLKLAVEFAEYAKKNHWRTFRFPVLEEAIGRDETSAYAYASRVLKGRFEQGEEALSKGYAEAYACHVLKGRFEKGEDSLAADARVALNYAKNALKGRFEKGEKVIGMNNQKALEYADFLYKNKHVTPVDAYEICLSHRKFERQCREFPHVVGAINNIFKHIIKHSADMSLNYAQMILDTPFLEAESVMRIDECVWDKYVAWLAINDRGERYWMERLFDQYMANLISDVNKSPVKYDANPQQLYTDYQFMKSVEKSLKLKDDAETTAFRESINASIALLRNGDRFKLNNHLYLGRSIQALAKEKCKSMYFHGKIEDAMTKMYANLCTKYLDNVIAWAENTKVIDISGESYPREPDERLMRSIEEKIDVAEQNVDDFRRMLVSLINKLAVEGKKFQWNSNNKLKSALMQKVQEHQGAATSHAYGMHVHPV